MRDSTLSSFVTAIGEPILMHDWPLMTGSPIRGVVILVHGFGEHLGRHLHVAQRLNAWGFAVRGYDQYGHGEGPGERGTLPTSDRLLLDLASVIDDTRTRLTDDLPIILFGHSLGGLVAARLVSLQMRPVDGLVLISPALRVDATLAQRTALALLRRLAPNHTMASGLDPSKLSHDPGVQQDWNADPLVHDRISARLARFIMEAGSATLASAATWRVPTLLLYAGRDHLVDTRGDEAFAAAAPKEYVSAHCFPTAYHELLNELEPEPVFDVLAEWLRARFVPHRTGIQLRM